MIDEVDADGCRGCLKRRWLVGFTRWKAFILCNVFSGGFPPCFFCWENFLGGGFIFFFHPYSGNIFNLINIFQMG